VKDWVHVAIVTVLRVGVVLSVVTILIGVVVTFVNHPGYFTSRPALGALTPPMTHFPITLGDVITGVRHGRGQAIITLGLLLLIATPVARVALSVIIFIIARDRLYTAITFVVLVILLISFAVGRATE
jgi:uncharacterized membrane protein